MRSLTRPAQFLRSCAQFAARDSPRGRWNFSWKALPEAQRESQVVYGLQYFGVSFQQDFFVFPSRSASDLGGLRRWFPGKRHDIYRYSRPAARTLSSRNFCRAAAKRCGPAAIVNEIRNHQPRNEAVRLRAVLRHDFCHEQAQPSSDYRMVAIWHYLRQCQRCCW